MRNIDIMRNTSKLLLWEILSGARANSSWLKHNEHSEKRKSADALRQAFRSKLLRGPGSWTFSYRFPLPRELHWDTVFGRVPNVSFWETASAKIRICSVSQWLSLGHWGGGQCFSQWARIAIPVAPTGNLDFSLLPVLISRNCIFPTFPKGIHWELYHKTFASEFLWELCRKPLPSGFLWEM